MTSSAPAVPQPLDHRFTAPIEKDGAFATYLTFPGSAELLGTGRAVKVTGTLDGHEFAATLMPSGQGPHWLPLRAALCRAIGKSDAGEEVEVHLQQRLT
jgi:hypothetical protein